MKIFFVLVLEYEENIESLFTDVGIGCTLDDQLFTLKEQGQIKFYQYAEVYKLSEEQYDKKMKLFFVVMMDYEKYNASFFTDDKIKCILDEQLFDLKERGHINHYEYAEVCEITEEQHNDFIEQIRINLQYTHKTN